MSRGRSLALAALLAAPASAADAPFRDLSFDEAKRAAAKEGKLLFVDFVSDHCGPCERMRRTTYKDEKVLARLATLVAVEPNADRVPKVARDLRVSAYPTLLLFSAQGAELDRAFGYHDGPALLKFLEDAAAGRTLIQSLDRKIAEEKFEDQRVQLRFERARALAGGGRDADALSELLWLYDEGMQKFSEYRGVRTSFLLSEIAQLGRRHPPALQALAERRERAWASLSANPPAESAAQDLAAIDLWSGRRDRTLADFDALPGGDPRRRLLAPRVFQALLAAKRYADAAQAQGITDYSAHFDREYGQYWNGGAAAAGFSAESVESMRHVARGDANNWLEALAGARRDADARRLIERARALDPSPDMRASLRHALEAASRLDLEAALDAHASPVQTAPGLTAP